MEKMSDIAERVLSKTSFWAELSAEEKQLVVSRSSIRKFAKNQLISSSDSSCMGVVFILSGGIRASLISEEGREITLWRLGEGDCCVTTASCVISQITFDTVVSAGQESVVMVIPSSICNHLSDKNIYFRAFIYEKETERFSQAIWVIQELLFKRFDQRLASYLLQEYHKTGNVDLTLTQERIAQEVNSAREVVTRMLKHFSAEGLVEVRRGHVVLRDIRGLQNLQ